MESECNCPGCGETFEDPRILPCKHVYCVTCVRDMSKTPIDFLDQSKGTKSCCFLCETGFTLHKGDPKSLPQSEKHLDIVETYKKVPTFVTFKCDGHPEKEAVKRCLSGCGHICEDCVSAHQTLRIIKSHKLVDVDKSRPVVFDTACPEHMQPFTEFCPKESSENPFMCAMCIGQHLKQVGKCSHGEFSTGAQKICKDLGDNKKKMDERNKSTTTIVNKIEEKQTEVENYISNLKSKAKEEFEKIRKVVDEEELRFMEKIDAFHKKIIYPFSTMREHLKFLKEHLEHSKKFVDESIKVFVEGKSPVKLPLAKRTSTSALSKKIPTIPESFAEFTETVPTFTFTETKPGNIRPPASVFIEIFSSSESSPRQNLLCEPQPLHQFTPFGPFEPSNQLTPFGPQQSNHPSPFAPQPSNQPQHRPQPSNHSSPFGPLPSNQPQHRHQPSNQPQHRPQPLNQFTPFEVQPSNQPSLFEPESSNQPQHRPQPSNQPKQCGPHPLVQNPFEPSSNQNSLFVPRPFLQPQFEAPKLQPAQAVRSQEGTRRFQRKMEERHVDSEEIIRRIMEIGFSRENAIVGLEATGGNDPDHAVEYLMQNLPIPGQDQYY